MRVLHIVGDSKWGGGGTVILGLTEVARELGWQVELLATDPVCRSVFERHGVEVVPLDVIRRNIRPARDLAGCYRLFRFLRNQRYDLVHTHTSKAGFVGRIAARVAGVPIVVHTAHSFSFHEDSSAVASAACRVLETFAALFCDRVVTVSNYHRDWGRRLRIASQDKLVSVPNGILAPRRLAASPCVRTSLGLAPGDVVLFTPGRLHAGKGLEYLIDALPLLAPRVTPNLHLVLAGDGALRSTLEARVSRVGMRDRVHFLGFRSDIQDLLAASSIVVLPSLHEGMSIALLEAMAAGKPIVATSIGGNIEATDGGRTAVLVPPKTPSALADGIAELIKDPLRCESLGKAAIARFHKYYTASRMLDDYRQVYLSLLESAGRAIEHGPSSSIWHAKE